MGQSKHSRLGSEKLEESHGYRRRAPQRTLDYVSGVEDFKHTGLNGLAVGRVGVTATVLACSSWIGLASAEFLRQQWFVCGFV
jgi:hypothetical protein